MVIYMDQYRTAKALPAAWLKNGTYGDEIMDANWNPAVTYMVRDTVRPVASPDLPDDVSSTDAEEFLTRVYGLASLI